MSVSLQACLFKFSLSISTPEMSLQSTIEESGMYLMQMQNSGACLLSMYEFTFWRKEEERHRKNVREMYHS